MNEAETRAEHIDPALKAAGWGVVEGSRILREYPITLGRIEGLGRRSKPLIADYILVYRNHKLAVVEAKGWDEALTEGVGQAKNYADKLAIRFTYATNGQGVYGIDMETGREDEVPQYPDPDTLWDLTFAKQSVWRDRFAAVPFQDKSGVGPLISIRKLPSSEYWSASPMTKIEFSSHWPPARERPRSLFRLRGNSFNLDGA